MSSEMPPIELDRAGRQDAAARRRRLSERYRAIRRFTEELCRPLSAEDCVVQSMSDASPAKWHLAHTTWYFETFVLHHAVAGYVPFHPRYGYLFNSYYNAVGDRHPRPQRGLLTRPTLDDVARYRRAVDERMGELLGGGDAEGVLDVVELGLHHEQQHQELLLADVKHLFWCNPLRPGYAPVQDHGMGASPSQQASTGPDEPTGSLVPMAWIEFPEGLRCIGHAGEGFAFDNESPRHRAFLEPFALGSRLVTNGEYRRFIEEGGYRRPELWLSDGWDAARALGWQAPLYWEREGDGWTHFTLAGMRPVNDAEPVCHVSFYEADAYARWTGCRLPTEAEWETAAADAVREGNFVESGRLHPAAAEVGSSQPLRQMFGDVWEWTASAYAPYPGYRPSAGALGEYNGKFMCNQMVLRGGSCATPQSHIRPTYRNFFQPDARWQFLGIRLARSR